MKPPPPEFLSTFTLAQLAHATLQLSNPATKHLVLTASFTKLTADLKRLLDAGARNADVASTTTAAAMTAVMIIVKDAVSLGADGQAGAGAGGAVLAC